MEFLGIFSRIIQVKEQISFTSHNYIKELISKRYFEV